MDASMKSCRNENGSQYFKQLNEVFNAEIDEVDIIPCVKSEEHSNSMLVDGNKIGILSWCVKELFCFAYKELMKLKVKQKDLIKGDDDLIGRYMMELSRAILLLTAEDYTVWNLRKQYVVRNKSSRNDEMHFCALVLKKHPRSSEAFAHRRWLIKDLLANNEKYPPSSILLSQELHLYLQCAEKYCDNYVAWSQRCWLVSQFFSDNIEQLLQELQGIEHWMWTHISDHCCFHYRQCLLKHLEQICSPIEIEELLLKEFSMMDEILRKYPGHETVWYHRRFLIDNWLSINPPCVDCLLHWQSVEKKSISVVCKRHIGNSGKPKCRYCELFNKQYSKKLLPNCEMCFSRKIMANDQSAETKRQSHLAASQLKWMHHFLQSKYFIGLTQQTQPDQ